MKLPWKKAGRDHATADEAGPAPEREAVLGEAEPRPEGTEAGDGGTPVQAAIEVSEWVREYSQKIADDAQRAIAELHQKIAESAERAMADFGGRRSAPDASPEESPSPDEELQPHESREDQEA